ncbi:hypothetical protein HW555_011538 [Spodoptera exigua]|uniref:Uncharacterized protein n=1 Tax=Spodoptera exigua TaxID=7107 RepID=A0A835G8P9_SPOEX|nr:hypothetical protein HW555_011538 [Spodoptera exigua]
MLPGLKKKNTGSKTKNNNCQTNSNHHMKSNDLQPSWKSPQNTSNSNFNRICGQRSGNESYHATKRIQNNHYLIKSRQFQSRIDFNIGEYQIGCCLNTRQNNLFTQSLYTPNVITNPSIPLKANKCEPGGCVQYEYDINNHFQRSKLCCAKALESNLVESYNNKYKLDKRAEVYTKSQKSTHVGKSEKQYISVKSDVHTRMGVNNDVKHHRKDELQKQTFLSKCLRSLFKKEKYKNVNQPVLRKNHSDNRLRKARHFRSDLHNDATLLKQAKYDNYFSVSDKTHNSRIENIRSQVNKTHSRATGLTKLLKQCYCTANMQYEIQKQSESQKVINNLTLNSLTVKSAKKSETARKIKSVVEPKKLDRAMRSHTNKYDPKDGNHKEIFRESQSTKTHRRLNQNSQTFGITYPKYNPASILSERSRTFQPKIHYKSREWSPRSNYYVLRCEDSQRSRVKFGTNFRMGIDFSKNKHGNICPGMTTSQRNQLEAAATGDGCGRPRKSSIKSYTDEDYTNYSVNKRGLKSKNTQYKRNKGTRSKSIIAGHDTKDEGSEIGERRNETGAARPTIVLEGKESEMIEATQTDREVKTIMPYSKKKFHKLESRTKLSHHSTNTPDNVNKLKFKGIKRNERIVINKNGDYLVYRHKDFIFNRFGYFDQKIKVSDIKSHEDSIVADRNATQEIIVTYPDGTQDKDGKRGIIRKFLGMYRKPGHQKVTKKRQKDKTPKDIVADRDASQGDFENRLDLIWKALARRPKQQVVMEKPLFEMLVQKDNMSILNKDEILPILKSRRYNTTAPRRTQGDFYIPPENIDENRLKMIRRALGLSQKPRASEKPLFDMMVQRQNMRILNKDEVLPILSTPEALRRRKAGPTSPPRMEIHVDKTTASIINSDEIISQLKKERRREMLRRHRAGLVSMSDGEALLKLHGKQCKCCFCRKYKQQRIIQKFKMKPRRLSPCICGSDICKKDWSKLKMEQSDLHKVKDIPTCVCGSKVCEEEIEKLPKRKLKAARRERVKERIKMKKKLYRQARKQRRKQYRLEDLKRLRRREVEDRRKMKKIKSLKSPPASIMAVESLKDMGAFGFRFIGDTMRSFSRIAKHPKDAMYNAHETMYAVKQDPKTVIKKVQQNYRETGLKPTVARVKQRAIQTSMGKRIKKKMESHPFTNYLVHLTDPDPKTWMKKKRRRRRHKEPVVYEGSLYMNTLRKKPFLRVYRMCPWFYPHCVSLFGLWKQLANVLMFLLAICVWSPCILCFEVCRALTCCCMCTGFDY